MTSAAAMNGAVVSELLPPQSVEAEEFALAAAFAGDASADELAGTLRPAEMYHATHRAALETIIRLRQQDKPIDGLMFPEELASRGLMERKAAFALAQRLSDVSFQSDHLGHYAGIVRQDWQRRELIALAGMLRETAYARQLPAEEIIAVGEARLIALNERGAGDGGIDAADLFWNQQQALERGDTQHYLRTGKPYIDRLLKPSRGHVMVIGARPSIGKTARAIDLALAYATQGHPVAFLSGEQSLEEIADRAKAQNSGVPLTNISDRTCNREQLADCARAALFLGGLPIRFYGGASLASFTVPAIRAAVLKQRRSVGAEVVIIDQLNRLEPSAKVDSENARFSHVMREVRNMAGGLGVFVIVLHQLSRKLEGRPNKRPNLADLRDSGNIEAEADIVMLLYRESYYWAQEQSGRDEPEDSESEAILAKVRQGQTAVIRDRYDRTTQRFYRLDTHHDEGGAGYPRRGDDDPFFETERGIR